ncbi:response regulator [Vibrio paucivorans]
MSKRCKVLIVGENRSRSVALLDKLSMNYDVKTVNDISTVHRVHSEFQPEIVIVDSQLYDEDSAHSEQPFSFTGSAIVYLTHVDSLEERLRVYEAGAIEVISAQENCEEVLAKLEVIEQFLAEQRSLQVECQQAKETSRHFMQEASMYGTVLHFFRGLATCQFIEQLSYFVFKSMDSYGLHASMVIRDDKDLYFDNVDVTVSPIERNIFDLLHTKGRVFRFGNRLILNEKNCAILIKNLPEDDEVKIGILQDVVAVIVEGLEAKYQDLKRYKTLVDVLEEINCSMEGVAEKAASFDARFSETYGNSVHRLNSSFYTLGLVGDQEEELLTLFEEGLKSMMFAKEDLNDVHVLMQSVADKIQSLDITTESLREPPQDPPDDGDVELF